MTLARAARTAWPALLALLGCLLLLVGLQVGVNSVARERILRAANDLPGRSLTFDRFSYNALTGRLLITGSLFSSEGTALEGNHLVLRVDTLSCSGVGWLQLAAGAGLRLQEAELAGVRCTIGAAPQRSARPSREEQTRSAPEGERTRELVPVHVRTLRIQRGTLLGADTIGQCTVTAQGLALDGPGGDLRSWAKAVDQLTVQLADVALHSGLNGYVARARALSLDTREEVLSLKRLSYAPDVPDPEFFARQHGTRFHVACADIALDGLAFRALREGRVLVRSAGFDSLLIDMLSDRRSTATSREASPAGSKTPAPTAHPRMPHELMASLPWEVSLDSLHIAHGSISYAEQFSYSSTPAVLRWTRVTGTGSGINNRPRQGSGSEAVLDVTGHLMDRGLMHLVLRCPLQQPSFTCSYSGSLGPMDLPQLNPWLEQSDRVKISSGHADRVDFTVRVVNGQAAGTVRPAYRNLTVRLLNKETGSPAGIVRAVGSFVANTFKIQSSNPPGPDQPTSEGTIAYTRAPGDTFFKFLWFSVRGGLKKVVGF